MAASRLTTTLFSSFSSFASFFVSPSLIWRGFLWVGAAPARPPLMAATEGPPLMQPPRARLNPASQPRSNLFCTIPGRLGVLGWQGWWWPPFSPAPRARLPRRQSRLHPRRRRRGRGCRSWGAYGTPRRRVGRRRAAGHPTHTHPPPVYLLVWRGQPIGRQRMTKKS